MSNKSDKGVNLHVSYSGTTPPLADSSGQGQQNQFRQKMVQVPGFIPPAGATETNLCPLPGCSQEDLNKFRSAGVLLQALAAEARAWSEQLPGNFRPAIVALLHGNLQVEVRSLAQVSFDGIRVEGRIDGRPCSVLAHQDTIQLMCYAVSTEAEEEQAHHPIGFIWPDHDEQI
jgi:hypothetical protein